MLEDISTSVPQTDSSGQTRTPAELDRRQHAVGTPSLAFFDGQGQLRYRYTGVLDPAGFARLLEFVRRGDYERQPFRLSQRGQPRLYAAAPSSQLPRQPPAPAKLRVLRRFPHSAGCSPRMACCWRFPPSRPGRR